MLTGRAIRRTVARRMAVSDTDVRRQADISGLRARKTHIRGRSAQA